MRTLLTLSFALLLGCAPEPRSSAAATQPDDLAAAVLAAHRRMHTRFAAARAVQDAIARSDLDRARASASALVAIDEPEVLAAWQPYFERLRDAAREVERAGDVATAARPAGVLGLRCAQCHVAIRARIALPVAPPPPEDHRLGPEMLGHQWAAAQMWHGLIAPSEERWMTGAQALTTAPLEIVAQATPRDAGDDVATLRLFARRALVTDTLERRAELFGDLLATCARCHAALRDR